ncbi:MAG: ATP-binding protein [Burkholderiales bacterium]
MRRDKTGPGACVPIYNTQIAHFRPIQIMASTPHRRFAAHMDSMAEIRAFIDGVCATAGIKHEECLKLQLIVEELFTNTITHGYGGNSDSPVWIALEPCAAGLALSYQDEAPPHDPLSSYRPMKTTILVAEQPVGGLGMQLIRKLATDLSYHRDQDRNCIRLTFTAGARG